MKLTPNQFKMRYGMACVKACNGTKLFPSVKLAQLAVETGWGQTIKGSNLFGIKADRSWTGQVISFTTQEVFAGKRQTFIGTGKTYANRAAAIADKAHPQTLFRYYASAEDSIKDHTDFLLKNKRYAAALDSSTPEEQAQDLEDAMYSTSKNYNETLESIINKYNFIDLDKIWKP